MKYCKGCRSIDRHCTLRIYVRYATKEAVSKTISKIGKCPCGTCLVKGVCRSPCEDYMSFLTIKY